MQGQGLVIHRPEDQPLNEGKEKMVALSLFCIGNDLCSFQVVEN